MVHCLKHLVLRGPQLLSSLRTLHISINMAKSKFEYVKSFEMGGILDPAHWIVVTLRCQNTDLLSQVHNFQQPNDVRFHQVMEASAVSVMEDFKELVLGYGFSCEFNFVFGKSTTLYRRRGPKLLTNLCSFMASSFVNSWSSHFGSVALNCLPVFEGVVHLFPEDQNLRDYMTQRQRVCHHKNLYNTCLTAMIAKGILPLDAARALKGTSEGEQNEILFSKCNINYNNEDAVYKKGRIAIRNKVQIEVTTPDGSMALRNQSKIKILHTDFTKNKFWKESIVLQQPTKNNSKDNYVTAFEKNIELLPETWIVVRIDGKGFHKFSEKHNFVKPNDIRSIELMNRAALCVMNKFPDIMISYGQSDEYSFIIQRRSKMMARKENTIMSSIVSLFAAKYVYDWQHVFEGVALQYCPAFDARVVLYPNNKCLRDYLSWRQADCHINNMYNTCFWKLVQNGSSPKEAEERLRGTVSEDKRSILSAKFDQEYDHEADIYKKGTVMIRKNPSLVVKGKLIDCVTETGQVNILKVNSTDSDEEKCVLSGSDDVIVEHVDLIKDNFWIQRHWLLDSEV